LFQKFKFCDKLTLDDEYLEYIFSIILDKRKNVGYWVYPCPDYLVLERGMRTDKDNSGHFKFNVIVIPEYISYDCNPAEIQMLKRHF